MELPLMWLQVHSRKSWFEHNQRYATGKQSLNCAHMEPEMKVRAKQRLLRIMHVNLEL